VFVCIWINTVHEQILLEEFFKFQHGEIKKGLLYYTCIIYNSSFELEDKDKQIKCKK
jgi:hypothetical protein